MQKHDFNASLRTNCVLKARPWSSRIDTFHDYNQGLIILIPYAAVLMPMSHMDIYQHSLTPRYPETAVHDLLKRSGLIYQLQMPVHHLRKNVA